MKINNSSIINFYFIDGNNAKQLLLIRSKYIYILQTYSKNKYSLKN